MTSRTQFALKLMEQDPEISAYAAAKAAKITPTTLYAAIKRVKVAQHRKTCPMCGQAIKDPK